ncbi:protein FAM200C-like [Tachypleus tridentatus]|uniref:protein FAM200C-like n=1 Tax=Tachypleus tridentatus TaxID=6853 RepID=UPI003FD0FDF3
MVAVSLRKFGFIISVKKRGYGGSYIQCGFISIIINGEERPRCVIYCKALSTDFMKPTKLKQHLQNVHPQHKDKGKSFFERHGNVFKKTKLDLTGEFQEMNQKEFLFRSPLETTIKASDILENVSFFFILWDNVCGCCTDGASAMLWTISGFQVCMKKRVPKNERHSKTLSVPQEKDLDQTIQIVNFVKGKALNLQLFKQLCTDKDASHNLLLFHTNVR